MIGNVGADIGAAEGGSGKSVAMCGNSLSANKCRFSGIKGFDRDDDATDDGGSDDGGKEDGETSGTGKTGGGRFSIGYLSTLELRRERDSEGTSGDSDGSSSGDLSSALSLSLSSGLDVFAFPLRLFCGW